MQRNCHEFIAYENLVGSRRGPDRKQSGPAVTQAPIDQAVPLVRRALKVLSDREVSPQLGLLKSTLLQLDSTFSERTYGVSSFRDFAEKLAAAGHVSLREHGRNVLVELGGGDREPVAAEEPPRQERREPRPERHERQHRPYEQERRAQEREPAPEVEPRAADGVREVRRIFQSAPNPPRWPMYIRQAKQFMRAVDPTFDERKFGFGNLVDLLRACQREGLLRIERDRQGVIRLFPGNIMQPVQDAGLPLDTGESLAGEPIESEAPAAAAAPEWAPHEPEWAPQERDWTPQEAVSDSESDAEVVDAAVVQELETAPVTDGEQIAAPAEEETPRKKPGARRKRTTSEPRGTRKTDGTAARARKTSRPRTTRARKQAAE
jgi:hypothetical protein